MTISEMQTKILTETGIKTSVKKGTGSQKEYFIFSPMFQNGLYPTFPFDWKQSLLTRYPQTEPVTIHAGSTQITLHKTVLSGETTQYQKERKPKLIDPDKPAKGWGSKNSQMRLDKAASRYAKRLNKGGCARYY